VIWETKFHSHTRQVRVQLHCLWCLDSRREGKRFGTVLPQASISEFTQLLFINETFICYWLFEICGLCYMFVRFVTLYCDRSALWRCDVNMDLYLVLSVFTSRTTSLLAAVRVSAFSFNPPDLNLSELPPFTVKDTKVFFFKLCNSTLIQGIKIPQPPSPATTFNNPKAFTLNTVLIRRTSGLSIGIF
jgi:hypothetical protein